MKLPLTTIDTCQTTFDGILKVHVPKYVLQFSKNRWPTLLSICLPSQKVAIQINLKILLHTQFTFYVHSQWWMTSEAKYCMPVVLVLVNVTFQKTSWLGLKKQDFWPNAYAPGLSGFWDQSQANSATYCAFWSVEQTDFKNVMVENIHWALFVDAEVAEVKRPRNSKPRAQWIFSTITFLKSVCSTDQNAL